MCLSLSLSLYTYISIKNNSHIGEAPENVMGSTIGDDLSLALNGWQLKTFINHMCSKPNAINVPFGDGLYTTHQGLLCLGWLHWVNPTRYVWSSIISYFINSITGL
jgi:hypothetical protein